MKGSWIASPRVVEIFPKQSVPWNRPNGNAVMITTIDKMTPPRIFFRPVDLQIWKSCSACLAGRLQDSKECRNPLRLISWHRLILSMIPVRFVLLAYGIPCHLKWFVILRRCIPLKSGSTRHDPLNHWVRAVQPSGGACTITRNNRTFSGIDC
jgi:hypothetical protein